MSYRSFVSIFALSLGVGSAACGDGTASTKDAGGSTSGTTATATGPSTTATTTTATTGSMTTGTTTGSAMGAPTVMFSVNPTTITAGTSTMATVTVTNFNLVDPATHPTNVAGEGHYHIYLDAQTNYLVAGQTPTVSVKIPAATAPGAHKLKISLSDNQHVPLSPPVQQILDITVQ